MAKRAEETSKPTRVLEELRLVGIAGVASLGKNLSRLEGLALIELGSILHEHELQQLPDDRVSLENRCIVLPLFVKDAAWWIPFLWVNVDCDNAISLQLKVASVVGSFGYRWESPEGDAAKPSDHGYWHAQPITTVRTGDREVPVGEGLWHASDHFPTFPIDATDQCGLLGALLVSLYGQVSIETTLNDSVIYQRLCAGTHRGTSVAEVNAAAVKLVKKGTQASKKKKR